MTPSDKDMYQEAAANTDLMDGDSNQVKDFEFLETQEAYDLDDSLPNSGVRPKKAKYPLNPEEKSREEEVRKNQARQRMAYARACREAKAKGKEPPPKPETDAFVSKSRSTRSKWDGPTPSPPTETAPGVIQTPPDQRRKVDWNRVRSPSPVPPPKPTLAERIAEAKANLSALEADNLAAMDVQPVKSLSGDTDEAYRLLSMPEVTLKTARVLLKTLGVSVIDLPAEIQGKFSQALHAAVTADSLEDRVFLATMQRRGITGRKLAEIITACHALPAFKETMLEFATQDQDDGEEP